MKTSILVILAFLSISSQARVQHAMLCKNGSTVESAVNQINAALYDVSLYKKTKIKEEGYIRVYSQDTEKYSITYHDLEVREVSSPTVTKVDVDQFTACVLVEGEAK